MTENPPRSAKELAAEACARHIWCQVTQHEEYTLHVESEGDPRDHILYQAAVVLGKEGGFRQDIVDWETPIDPPEGVTHD